MSELASDTYQARMGTDLSRETSKKIY